MSYPVQAEGLGKYDKLVFSAVPAETNLTENEKIGKYLDHAGELKKLWYMNVTVIIIGVGVLVQ